MTAAGRRRSVRCALIFLHTDGENQSQDTTATEIAAPDKNMGNRGKVTSNEDAAVVLASLLVDAALFTTVGVIGALHFGFTGREYCQFPAPLILVIFGFPNLLFTVGRTPWFHRGAANFFQGLFNVGICIYGSAEVWPHLSRWTPEDRQDEHYCERVPFITAVVVLIVLTAWTSVLLLIVLILCLLGTFRGFEAEEATAQLHSVTESGETAMLTIRQTRYQPFKRFTGKRFHWQQRGPFPGLSPAEIKVNLDFPTKDSQGSEK